MHRLLIQTDASALDAAHIENIVDQAQQVRTGGADLRQIILHQLRVADMGLRQRRKTDNGIHRRPDIMGHAVQESCFGTAGLLGSGKGQRKLLLLPFFASYNVINRAIRQHHLIGCFVSVYRNHPHFKIFHAAAVRNGSVPGDQAFMLCEVFHQMSAVKFMQKIRCRILNQHVLIGILNPLGKGRHVLLVMK